jgi:hypothetical protein
MYIDPVKLVREMAATQVRLQVLETAAKEQKGHLVRLEATRNKIVGGWAALATVGTIAGVLGAIIARVFFH